MKGGTGRLAKKVWMYNVHMYVSKSKSQNIKCLFFLCTFYQKQLQRPTEKVLDNKTGREIVLVAHGAVVAHDTIKDCLEECVKALWRCVKKETLLIVEHKV